MAKKAAENKLPEVLGEVQQEALDLLSADIPQPNKQLCLFEDWADWNAQLAKKNPKNKDGLTLHQEVFARLCAAQLSKTEAYRRAFPNCKTEKLTTIYPKASRLANTDKVRARILALEKQIADSALMSTTEYYGHLNDEIRKGGKDKGAALKIVAQIKGLLQADKGQPGSAEAPFVICLERNSEGGRNRAAKN